MENFFGLLKMSCYICKNFSLRITLNKNELTIWTITTTGVLKKGLRACRLRFTDNKPFQLFEQFFLQKIV